MAEPPDPQGPVRADRVDLGLRARTQTLADIRDGIVLIASAEQARSQAA